MNNNHKLKCLNENCGKDFFGYKKKKFCSKKCMPSKNNKYKCLKCKKNSLGLKNQKFCSIDCRNSFYGLKSSYSKLGLSTATVGAIQEYKTSIELLTLGYEVFKAVSPSCSCDLVGFKNGEFKRFEVRTGYYTSKKPKFTFPKYRINCEIIAVALPDKIKYLNSKYEEISI